MADGNGGALFAMGQTVNIEESTFTGNSTEEDGGAIWMDDIEKLFGEDITFSTNKSQQGYWTADADKDIHDTQFAGTITATAPFTYAYNNHDIAYTDGVPFTQTYQVTYNANGAAQASYTDLTPITHGDSYTVLGNDFTNFSRAGYDFVGWNTAANGLGTRIKQKTVFFR